MRGDGVVGGESGFERAAYAVMAMQAHQEQTKRLEDLENMLATITEQVSTCT